jgi:hypothetical protein
VKQSSDLSRFAEVVRTEPRAQLCTVREVAQALPYHVSMERRDERSRSARLERVKLDVAARLRQVCRNMSEVEFTSFVERVSNIKLKYLFRRTGDFFQRDR